MSDFKKASWSPNTEVAPPIKVLIADDNDSDRMILKAIVKKQGHEVITARDGLEAVEKFKSESPQIILLDALMPRMDGFEAACTIKYLAGEELVPILFLTSLSDAESLAQCLEAGGDDFISKPYNKIILQAKINAFNRMRIMHHEVQAQRDQIAENNRHLLQEQQVAKTVFDNVAHLGCLHASNIKHLLSPLSVFNGDVLLACRTPSGGMHVLLGDFTGHGLPAAIGAMPLAEIFYGMTNKGFGLTDVLREINQKLKSILPVGIFCCACMVNLNFVRKDIEVWIGGLPDAYLYRIGEKGAAGTVETIPSNHLPLGVLAPSKFAVETFQFEIKDGDRLFMWSDGIIEARNEQGDMFGNNRLMQVFNANRNPLSLFGDITDNVHAFIGSGERDDDLTLVEVAMCPQGQLGLDDSHVGNSGLIGPVDWYLEYELRAHSLRDFNPLPLLLHVTMEVPGLRLFSGQVYTILAELISNALEHGILQLDSSLKKSQEGFADYYQQRADRLQNLDKAWIKVRIEHNPRGEGGVLFIRVEDSGKGFDYKALSKNKARLDGYSGRGCSLLKHLCQRFEFKGEGNIVEVEYAWQP
jgi:DNA-binding response OmpR family regulator